MGPYRASYFDGRSAADWEVLVRPVADGLRIEGQDGGQLAWPYTEIQVVDEVVGREGLRLRRKGGSERLTVADPGVLDDLPPDLGAARQAQANRRRLARNPLVVLAALGAAMALVWAGFPLAVRATAAVVPVTWERALGDWVLDDVLDLLGLMAGGGKAKACAETAGSAALAGLTEELAAASGSPYEFRVLVVDVGMTNAFALPGGAIVMFSGLIDFAETPEEVAGVLAHEMGHVVKRHGTEVILRNYGLQLLVHSLTGGAGGGMAEGIGKTLLGLSYSREAEREADETGIRLLQTAGLRADGLGRFFVRFGEQHAEGPAVLNLLSTHPSSESRARLAERAGSAGRPAMSAADWQAVKAICGPKDSDATEEADPANEQAP